MDQESSPAKTPSKQVQQSLQHPENKEKADQRRSSLVFWRPLTSRPPKPGGMSAYRAFRKAAFHAAQALERRSALGPGRSGGSRRRFLDQDPFPLHASPERRPHLRRPPLNALAARRPGRPNAGPGGNRHLSGLPGTFRRAQADLRMPGPGPRARPARGTAAKGLGPTPSRGTKAVPTAGTF